MAIIVPILGAVYLMGQIHKRDLRGWQHYACLTTLIFLISILFLVASGKVESFDVAGSNIRMVDQKLEEIKALTEQNRRIAKATADLGLNLASLTAEPEIPDIWKENREKIISLLKEAGDSNEQISQFLKRIDSRFPTNAFPPIK